MILEALIIASLLPVWRIPGRDPDEGHSIWDTAYAFMYEVEHIPIEQAIAEAREYYESQ